MGFDPSEVGADHDTSAPLVAATAVTPTGAVATVPSPAAADSTVVPHHERPVALIAATSNR